MAVTDLAAAVAHAALHASKRSSADEPAQGVVAGSSNVVPQFSAAAINWRATWSGRFWFRLGLTQMASSAEP